MREQGGGWGEGAGVEATSDSGDVMKSVNGPARLSLHLAPKLSQSRACASAIRARVSVDALGADSRQPRTRGVVRHTFLLARMPSCKEDRSFNTGVLFGSYRNIS